MRSKIQSTAINPKLIFIFLVFTSNFSASSLSSSDSCAEDFEQTNPTNSCPDPEYSSSSSAPPCTKIPASLANAVVHYATTNITPQQTLNEISTAMRVLDKKSPCNFLVFGLGNDTLMWTALNHGGRIVFLEEASSWIDQVKTKLPNIEAYHVVYDTVLTQADELLQSAISDEECRVVTDPRLSKCKLAFKGFPNEVYDTEWDVIMIDAPTGYHDEAPGRMSAIYTAGLMARNRESGETDVFVHDVDRETEDKFSKEFLCEGYMREQVEKIRHFTLPSHRRPFCP